MTEDFLDDHFWFAGLAWARKMGVPYDDKQGHRLGLEFNSGKHLEDDTEKPGTPKHPYFRWMPWIHPLPQPTTQQLLELTVEEVADEKIRSLAEVHYRNEAYLLALIKEVIAVLQMHDIMAKGFTEEDFFKDWLREITGVNSALEKVRQHLFREVAKLEEPGGDTGKQVEEGDDVGFTAAAETTTTTQPVVDKKPAATPLKIRIGK